MAFRNVCRGVDPRKRGCPASAPRHKRPAASCRRDRRVRSARSTSLPFIHSVISATTGWRGCPNSVARPPEVRRDCAPPQSPPSACRNRCRKTAPCVRGRISPPRSCLRYRARQNRPEQNAVAVFQMRRRVGFFKNLRFDPVHFDANIICQSAMRRALRSATCMNPSPACICRRPRSSPGPQASARDPPHTPARQIGRRRIGHAEDVQDLRIESFRVIADRRVIDRFQIGGRNDAFRSDIAEQRDLTAVVL